MITTSGKDVIQKAACVFMDESLESLKDPNNTEENIQDIQKDVLAYRNLKNGNFDFKYREQIRNCLDYAEERCWISSDGADELFDLVRNGESVIY